MCTYPIWGLGSTVGLDSWGEGFLIFLKITFLCKRMEEGKSKHIRCWSLAGGRGSTLPCLFSLFSIGNGGLLLLSGVRTFLIGV